MVSTVRKGELFGGCECLLGAPLGVTFARADTDCAVTIIPKVMSPPLLPLLTLFPLVGEKFVALTPSFLLSVRTCCYRNCCVT